MSGDKFTSCTGPYTRIPFAHRDLKPTQDMRKGLACLDDRVIVREQPSGRGGPDDFNFHIDIEDTATSGFTWDVRAAKFLGPKKLFARGHIYEIAVRKRDANNAVLWEGYLFDVKFAPLTQRFVRDLPHLMQDNPTDDWLPKDRAQAQRIHLCTGESSPAHK